MNSDTLLFPKSIGKNVFAYCENNPVTNYDPTGRWVISIPELFTIGCGWGMTVGLQLSFDGNGHLLCQAFCNSGTYAGATISGGIGAMYYNDIESVYDLDTDISTAFGTSGEAGCGGGIDCTTDQDGNLNGCGGNICFGLGYGSYNYDNLKTYPSVLPDKSSEATSSEPQVQSKTIKHNSIKKTPSATPIPGYSNDYTINNLVSHPNNSQIYYC